MSTRVSTKTLKVIARVWACRASRAPTDISERVSVCLSTGFVPVDQTGGVVMAWRFGRLTGLTMRRHGTVVSQHGELLSDSKVIEFFSG